MAEDAVVGLVEGAREIHPRVGQLETLAPAPVMDIEFHHRNAVVLGADDRNQVVGIEFARRFEQYAGPMLGAARRRERRPGGIAGREVEIVAMDGCILLPGEHVTGESEFAQGLAQTLRQFPLERRPVEGLG